MAAEWGLPAIIGLVGGVVGLIGGVLSLHDRFTKGRPVASLTTSTSGFQKLIQIRIENTTRHDIIITGAAEQSGAYFLSDDFETGNLLRGQLKEGMIHISCSSREAAKS